MDNGPGEKCELLMVFESGNLSVSKCMNLF